MVYYKKRNVRIMNISSLYENSFEIDEFFSNEELDEKLKVVTEHGLTDPIHVKKRNGKYEVVSGELFWKIAKILDIKKVPVIIEKVWMGMIGRNNDICIDTSYTIKRVKRKKASDNEAVYTEIFNKTLKNDHHTIMISMVKGDSWALREALESFAKSNPNYELDVLFLCSGKQIKDDERDFLRWARPSLYRVNRDYLNKLSLPNGWKSFCHNLMMMQYRINGSCVELWEESSGKSVSINPVNNATCKDFVYALEGLDTGFWITAMDFRDLERIFFQEGALSYFFRWTGIGQDYTKIMIDVDGFLKKNRIRVDRMLMWLNGTFTVSDLVTIEETWIYEDCQMIIETGAEEGERSINVILTCKPGNNEYIHRVNPEENLNRSSYPDYEPDFEKGLSNLEKGNRCADNRYYLKACYYYKLAIDNEDSAEAYYRLGALLCDGKYYDGEHYIENAPKGYKYMETAYEKGFTDIGVGNLLMIGAYHQYDTSNGIENGMLRDIPLAIKWYERMLERCKKYNYKEQMEWAYGHMGAAYLEKEVLNYKKAYECLKLAKCSFPKASFCLGWLYERGFYVKQNIDKAKKYFNITVDRALEDDLHCELASEELKKLKNIPEGGEKEFAIKENEVDYLMNVASGLIDNEEYTKALEQYLKVYKITKSYYPNKTACYQIAKFYRLGGKDFDRDYAKSFKFYNVLAKMGENKAKLEIINLYNAEKCKDKPKVVARYLKDLEAADYKPAYYYLAGEYETGENLLKKDIDKAIEYYEKCSAEELAPGYESLALMYYFGKYVPKDYEKAIVYFLLVKDEFVYPESCYALADIFDKGLTGVKDRDRAIELYRKAIEKWEYDFEYISKEDPLDWDEMKKGYNKAKRRLKKLENI